MREAKELSLYLDTSVWGFLFEQEAAEKRGATEIFLAEVERSQYRIYISGVVLTELVAIPIPKLRKSLFEVMKRFAPTVLPLSDEIETLADKLMTLGGILLRYRDDAGHIPDALFYEMNILVSWNLRHIVRYETKRVVSALARLEGLRELEILIPEEVISHED